MLPPVKVSLTIRANFLFPARSPIYQKVPYLLILLLLRLSIHVAILVFDGQLLRLLLLMTVVFTSELV